MAIQLHAAPCELIEFAERVARAYDLQVIVMEFPPARYRRVAIGEVASLASQEQVKKITLLREAPIGESELKRKCDNDAIVIELSWPRGQSLRQSWVAACTEDPAMLAIWKPIARQLRAMSRAGATAVNSQTGASAHYKVFRHTEAARRLAAEGITMLPIAGGTVLSFDE
jgi:hypothetical protein